MIPPIERLIVKILQSLPVVPERISSGLVQLLQGVVKGFESIRSPKNLVVVLFYSFTLWILVAIKLEERDLAHFLGEPYRQYRERTSMLVPLLRSSRDDQ